MPEPKPFDAAAAQKAIDEEFSPLLLWMKQNGVKRYSSGKDGVSIELEDAPQELVRLRVEARRLLKLCIDNGVLRERQKYAMPDSPWEQPEPVDVVLDDERS